MKKLFTLLCMALAFIVTAPSYAEAQKIAIVPYLDTTEENKDYLPDLMKIYYDDAMVNLGLDVVGQDDVKNALDQAGYDVSNQIVADKDILSEVAEKTGADYVVAVELSALKATTHLSFFQKKISVFVKLRYNFYITQTGKMMGFQVTGADDNKAVFGDVGTKTPINNALKQATEKADEKIKGYITSGTDVIIEQ